MYLRFVKPMLDFLIALIVLPFILLVIILVGPVIYLQDRGPVFHNALRRGKDYKIFRMYKLRTMKVNSPDIRNDDGSTYNNENDPRVTKIGKILRKASIDELPQFLNVLKGDMSIVGPRPTLCSDVNAKCKPEKVKRYYVRPGVTGYGQAYFRNSISAEEKLKYDMYYVDNVSFLMDIKIIFRTFISVLKKENIYIKETAENRTVKK